MAATGDDGKVVPEGGDRHTVTVASADAGAGELADKGKHRTDARLLFNYTGQQASSLTIFTYCNYLTLEFH